MTVLRIVRRALALLVVVVAGFLAASVVTSDAARLATHGWWWRTQTEALPVRLDPPPHVPQGGLAVGRNVDGATAISALRFELAENETNPVLTLTVANDFSGPEIEIAACHAGDEWFGTQAGVWEHKPTAACDLGSVQGIPADDGTEWTFPVGSLALGGLVDVVLVPGEGEAPFEISFERPTSADLQTTVVTDSGRVAPPPPPPAFFIPGPSSQGGFAPPSAPARPFEPALTPEEQQPRPGASVSRSQQAVFGESTAGLFADDEGDPRPVALLVLFAGLVLAAFLSREPTPAPRLLGPFRGNTTRAAAVPAEPDVRGLGRFSRPRTGEPPNLV